MDIERLLGKLLNEVKDSGGDQLKKKYKKHKKGSKKKSKKNKKSKQGSLLDNLTSSMTSGKGLLTAIGLGVGAYEIYQSSRQPQAAAGSPPPSLPGQSVSSPPPPPLPPRPAQGQNQSQAPPHSAPPPRPPVTETPSAAVAPPVELIPESPVDAPIDEPVVTHFDEQETARRLIQVMVGAAHADGTLDADEEKAILDRLREVDLDQEEKMFILNELHQPLTIAELTGDIDDPRIGQTMYAVAVSALIVDTESERQWLDDLGEALGISPDLQQFIQEHH